MHDIEKCKECNLCVNDCEFLRRYGNPGEIYKTYMEDKENLSDLPFLCSLCSLCDNTCPFDVNPSKLFLSLREKAVKEGYDLSAYNRILYYEKRGSSDKYSYYFIPEESDSVFFPGCTLTGTRKETTEKTYQLLKEIDEKTGLVLDCCIKPSHDLGRKDFFESKFGEKTEKFKNHGIKTIITACPNCYKVFSQYSEFKTVMVYEVIKDVITPEKISGVVAIHDSCVVRNNSKIHGAVRELIGKTGLDIKEIPHSKEKTYCCGEGGSVGFIDRKLAQKWSQKRYDEVGDLKTITYCAGCSGMLSKADTVHILDLVTNTDNYKQAKVTKAPFTYLKRLRFKKDMINKNHKENPKSFRKNILKFGLLAVIIGLIIAVRASGLTEYLDQEKLRSAISDYGSIAPLIYFFIYLVAPSLFLPGLPITVVGGILFGPVWGTVYSITSATLGAGIAFLISRYISGDIIRSRMENSRIAGLYNSVEKHGWKIVAFTRLVPLFPFNVLNYAFGLTNIKFSHYMITSFICMLPGCVAIIVFSSSLLDIIKGKITMEFLVGLILMIIVSMIPFIYKKFKSKSGSGFDLE